MLFEAIRGLPALNEEPGACYQAGGGAAETFERAKERVLGRIGSMCCSFGL